MPLKAPKLPIVPPGRDLGPGPGLAITAGQGLAQGFNAIAGAGFRISQEKQRENDRILMLEARAAGTTGALREIEEYGESANPMDGAEQYHPHMSEFVNDYMEGTGLRESRPNVAAEVEYSLAATINGRFAGTVNTLNARGIQRADAALQADEDAYLAEVEAAVDYPEQIEELLAERTRRIVDVGYDADDREAEIKKLEAKTEVTRVQALTSQSRYDEAREIVKTSPVYAGKRAAGLEQVDLAQSRALQKIKRMRVQQSENASHRLAAIESAHLNDSTKPALDAAAVAREIPNLLSRDLMTWTDRARNDQAAPIAPNPELWGIVAEDMLRESGDPKAIRTAGEIYARTGGRLTPTGTYGEGTLVTRLKNIQERPREFNVMERAVLASKKSLILNGPPGIPDPKGEQLWVNYQLKLSRRIDELRLQNVTVDQMMDTTEENESYIGELHRDFVRSASDARQDVTDAANAKIQPQELIFGDENLRTVQDRDRELKEQGDRLAREIEDEASKNTGTDVLLGPEQERRISNFIVGSEEVFPHLEAEELGGVNMQSLKEAIGFGITEKILTSPKTAKALAVIIMNAAQQAYGEMSQAARDAQTERENVFRVINPEVEQ